MPYRRKYNRKSNGRPGYRKCAKMVYGDASKALSMARHLKSMLNVEFKNHDVSVVGGTIIDGAGFINQLTNIPQGDGTSARDGANVKITSIYCKLLIDIHASATTSQVRLLLVEDKQTNQAIYTAADLLQTVVNIQSIVSPKNLDNQFRFNVLHDKVYTLSATGTTSKYITIYKKVSKRLRFDASTPSIADLRSSSYSLLWISNEPTNAPGVSAEFRLRYVDN